jgi:uncharacterized membrane protein
MTSLSLGAAADSLRYDPALQERRALYDPAMASRRTPASFSLSPLHGGRRARRRRAGALRPALLALSLAACAVVVLAVALATRL